MHEEHEEDNLIEQEYDMMSEAELLALFDEIEDEIHMQDLNEQAQKALSNGELLPGTSLYDDDMERLKVPFKDWADLRRIRAAEVNHSRAEERRQIRKQIQRDAIMKDGDKMADPVTRAQLIELIRISTKGITDDMDAILASLNKKATIVLHAALPKSLRTAYKLYSRTVIPRSPGFMYVASKEFGGGEQLWLTPDVPCYFEQFTERSVIEKQRPIFIFTMDKLVAKYYSLLKQLKTREVGLAYKLYGIFTRYELLKKQPDLYKIYVDNKLYDIQDEYEN